MSNIIKNNNNIGNISKQFSYSKNDGINNHRKWLDFGQAGVGADILALDSWAANQSYTQMNTSANVAGNVTSIQTVAPSLTVIATPRTGAMAEAMSGNTSFTLNSQFIYSYWDIAATLAPVDSLGGAAIEGKPFLGLAFWDTVNAYRGILLLGMNNTSLNTLASIFNPATSKVIDPAVVENGVITPLTQGNWNFSNNQQPGANGYNLTSRFSVDDGCWGINPGGSVDGNTPGPALSSGTGYGFNNYNAGDTSANIMFWGPNATSATIQSYLFTAFA